MALSVLDDKSRPPLPEEVARALGDAYAYWKLLIEQIAERHPPITEAWNYGGAKFGWSLRLKQKERVVLYLIPQSRSFLTGIVLGDKAIVAARSLPLPASVVTLIDGARRYAEGTGFRMPVASAADLIPVLELTALKLAK